MQARPLRKLVVVTGNRGKLEDLRYLFHGSGLELAMPADFGVSLDVEETGSSFEANALIKARAYAALIEHPVLADDSGLVVAALDGRPGVQSARYAGEDAGDSANNAKLLAELRGVGDRRAAFVCVLALLLPGGEEIVVEGRCEGRVLEGECGGEGFGYDPVFFHEGLGCSFGEAAPEQKNANSHRAAAVRELLAELRRRGLL